MFVTADLVTLVRGEVPLGAILVIPHLLFRPVGRSKPSPEAR